MILVVLRKLIINKKSIMIIFVRNGEKKGYKEYGLSDNGIK